MSNNIEKMALSLEQLCMMSATIDVKLAVRILLASIKTEQLGPVVAAIKTLSEKDVQ